jgi:divalent metal cation (Fe/Co/Zn/Cd) transporter
VLLRKIGSAISADVHVQVDPFLSVSEGHIISVSVERVAKKCLCQALAFNMVDW